MQIILDNKHKNFYLYCKVYLILFFSTLFRRFQRMRDGYLQERNNSRFLKFLFFAFETFKLVLEILNNVNKKNIDF